MIRKFIEFAIDKPILNHIFLLFIFILSIFSYINIPKEIFPPSSLDKITITGSYPGASADILDKMAVKEIEENLKNLSDIKELDSVVKNGMFSITADIKPGADKILLLNDVKDEIAKVKPNLPSDMNEPVAKIAQQTFPLVLVAIATEKGKKELLEVADRLKSELSNIKNLSDIIIRGDADEELFIAFDEKKIDAYGLAIDSVVNAVRSLSSIFPIGDIKEKGNHLFLSTQNGKKTKSELENTIINVNGKKIYLKDIARVDFTLSDPDQLSHFNGKPNVSININKSKEGNAIELVKEIKKLLAEFGEKYPEFTFEIYTDTSIWIRNRLNTVTSNLIFGLFLVFSSLLLSVNARIAAVVGMGIPLSFMIGIIAAKMMGFSLNMLSLLGALIALGMLVDEAIVVAENIYRHLEMGKERRQAAIDGAVEMFPAVLTATATTVFAFLPLLILSGEMGMFLKILPIMISILLVSSLFEAFYFLPLHAKDILKVSEKKERSKRFWDKMGDIYVSVLNRLLKRKYISFISMALIIILSTIYLFKQSKFQLFPEFDTTQIYVSGRVNINNDIFDTEKIVTEVEKVILRHIKKNEISSVTSVIGMKLDAKNQPEMGDNYFHIFINLHEPKPKNFVDKYINPYLSFEYDDSDMIRERSAREIADEIKKITEKFITDRRFEEFNIIVPQAGIVKSDIEVSFSASDDEKILWAVKKMEEKMKKINGVYNINDDAKEGKKELKFLINDYGEKLGITEQYLYTALKPLFLKGEYAKMFKEGNLLKIKFASIDKDRFDTLKNLEISVPGGPEKVKLTDVADFEFIKRFDIYFKENGEKIRTVYASLDKKILTSGDFYKQVSSVLDEIKKEGVKIIIKGEEKENKKVQLEIAEAAIIAIFLIFLALVWMFDSVVLPLIVISSIPLSLLGVLIGHKIMGINLTLPSMIGIVGLAGVVVNDGLIMLDFIKRCKDTECLLKKAKMRLRPILLTSLTTVLGLSTLMFFASGQSLILQPMALTLGFGIAWATILNLYFVPLFFSIVYKIEDKIGYNRNTKK
ncbi:efflux RND transporter permease subunit [Nitrosophilus alvini]|uniref:efflux RND transporter permease subunit n=1 Tax=Nitrosophilus alvini TaxID=2714855 RepID=UPI001F35338F|nr:efflux RND transporter permease subunit [Nitrosophilus alvini]